MIAWKLAFLTLAEGNELITSSKFNFLANSDSKHKVTKPDTLVCVWQERWKFFILAEALNERSPLATETGRVQNIRRAMQTLGKSPPNFFALMAFSKLAVRRQDTKFAL